MADMDYSLILEKAKFLYLEAFLIGMAFSWGLIKFDTFVNFLCKLVRKYIRFKRLKRKDII